MSNHTYIYISSNSSKYIFLKILHYTFKRANWKGMLVDC